jgi:hypothetical protein
MSWTRTYTHNVLIGLDMLGAAIFFNRNDITISSMCRLVQLYDREAPGAAWCFRRLKLWKWQVTVLRWLAIFLDDLQKNHCAQAFNGDARRAISLLSFYDATYKIEQQESASSEH